MISRAFAEVAGQWAIRLALAAAVGVMLFPVTTNAQSAGKQLLHGHVPPAVARFNLQRVGRLPATNVLHLAIGLPLRNEAALDSFLQRLYDPGSTNFHRYLTLEQFTAQFGPTEQDYEAVKDFARTNGLTVITTYGNRLVLDVSGPAVAVERAFNITLRTYRHPTEARDFYAPDAEPTVDAALPVVDIQGLSDFPRPHPKYHRMDAAVKVMSKSGSSPDGNGYYFGNDFRNAYAPGTVLTGAGQSVGLFEADGFLSSDIAAYATAAGGGRTNIQIQTILIDGFNGNPTSLGPNSGDVEVSLDIEMAMAMAPGLAKIVVFEGNPTNGFFSPNNILNSMLSSSNTVKNLSSSWSWNGLPYATTDNIFKIMLGVGQSFFNASGDNDAFTTGANSTYGVDNSSNPNPTTPASSPYITQVGGTTLTMNGTGASYASETVWNYGVEFGSGYDGIGSGGGISSYYSIPSWQTNVSNMAGRGGSASFRNIPDVAMTADNVFVDYGNGSSERVGGTSCAAPLWAGFIALVNQQAGASGKPPVGFINPAIYTIAAGSNYSLCFYDPTTGNNTWSSSPSSFYATNGYDLCTGLGSPNGTNLINTLAPPVYFTAITNAGWTLLFESGTPTNGVIDPGETVTVGLTLQNQGTLAPGNLVATLQPNAGVLAPGGPQTYGALAVYGGSASQPFTFTAAGTCGSNIVATLQLQDGTNNLGTVSFTLPLGEISTNYVQTFAQNFDGVTAPALPLGWTTTNIAGTANGWATATTSSDTSPNSVFISDIASTSENALVSPVIPITSANARLSFRHNYSFDYHSGSSHVYRDGGVLEIKIGNGSFTDILAAGGSFVTGGYNNTINTANNNPLNGRSAWVGIYNFWQTVTVNLPASAAGQNIQFRWNCGTDNSNTGSGTGAVGWYVDTMSVSNGVIITNCSPVFTDLAVSQTISTNSLQPGQNLVYTLTVTNLGPQAAANVILTDTMPANVTFVSASSGYTYSAGQVVWPVGMLATAASTNFLVTFAPAGGNVFTNLVSVGTVTPEITTASNSATLVSTQTVPAPPSITIGPTSQTIQCGSIATFTATATGPPPLNYQWSLDGSPVVGATNASLALTNLHLPSHTVSVTVTNLYGGATSNAVLEVIDTLPPVILLTGGNPVYVELGSTFTDPGGTANDICAGDVSVAVSGGVNIGSVGTNTLTYTAGDGNGNTNSVTRTVIVRDTTPPTILWSFTNLVLAANTNCSAPMPNLTGTNFILATDLSGALTISQNPTNNFTLPLGTNVVVITVADASGNTTFSTNTIVVQDETSPLILSQPQNQTNLVGTTASFSAVATACTPLAYQWFFNNAVLTSQTNTTLTLTPVNLTNAGNYSVTVTASGGSTNSAVATLTVFDPAPVIAGVTANPDGSFTLNLAGAPGSTYILEMTTNLVPTIVWRPIATNKLDTSGVWQFTDPQAVNFQQQFYRLELGL